MVYGCGAHFQGRVSRLAWVHVSASCLKHCKAVQKQSRATSCRPPDMATFVVRMLKALVPLALLMLHAAVQGALKALRTI